MSDREWTKEEWEAVSQPMSPAQERLLAQMRKTPGLAEPLARLEKEALDEGA